MDNSAFDSQADPLRFTETELDVLGRTADALSAWTGKPVLAQVVDSIETGYEWVVFAVPLLPNQDTSDITVVQVGGPHARLIGNKGGLTVKEGEIYDCEYLWAVQLSDIDGIRFIKIDGDGEEAAWTNDLTEIVPFDLKDVSEDAIEASDDDIAPSGGADDSNEDDGFPYRSSYPATPGKPTLH